MHVQRIRPASHLLRQALFLKSMVNHLVWREACFLGHDNNDLPGVKILSSMAQSRNKKENVPSTLGSPCPNSYRRRTLGRRRDRKRKINDVLNCVRAEQTRRFENLRVLLPGHIERE